MRWLHFGPNPQIIVAVVTVFLWIISNFLDFTVCGFDTDQTLWRIYAKFSGYVYHHGTMRWLHFGPNPQKIVAVATVFLWIISNFWDFTVCGCDTDQTTWRIYAKFSGYVNHHGTMRWLHFGPNPQIIVAVATVFLWIISNFWDCTVCGCDTDQTLWPIYAKFSGYVYHHVTMRWLDFGPLPQENVAVVTVFLWIISNFWDFTVCGCDTDQTPWRIYAKFSGYVNHHGTMRWLDFGPNSQKNCCRGDCFSLHFFLLCTLWLWYKFIYPIPSLLALPAGWGSRLPRMAILLKIIMAI